MSIQRAQEAGESPDDNGLGTPVWVTLAEPAGQLTLRHTGVCGLQFANPSLRPVRRGAWAVGEHHSSLDSATFNRLPLDVNLQCLRVGDHAGALTFSAADGFRFARPSEVRSHHSRTKANKRKSCAAQAC